MSRRTRSALVSFGGAFILAVGFAGFTGELIDETSPDRLDLFVLREVSEVRSPLITTFFINFTALGSATLVTLQTVIGFALLMSAGKRMAAAQLAVAAGGAHLLTETAKALIGRPRPAVIPALVEAVGSSYPSGHAVAAAALYVTLAFLASRYLVSRKQRILLCVFTAIVVAGVAFSRVYLGVHYASDVVSGVCLGAAWALLLEGGRSIWSQMRIEN